MPDREEILRLVDELLRLAEGSNAETLEVEADGVTVTVRRDVRAAAEGEAIEGVREREAIAEPEKVQRVRATTVGIFSAAKEWRPGDAVKRGTILGAIQSLGHVADITAPADGTIQEILAAAGAPVEYGQPLFAIALA
ncbi:MAG: biotin/lipoyl-containing protein [Chloroflexota bacterium]